MKITPNVSTNSINPSSSVNTASGNVCFVPQVSPFNGSMPLPNFLYPPPHTLPPPSSINGTSNLPPIQRVPSSLPYSLPPPPVGLPPPLSLPPQSSVVLPPISPFPPLVMYPPPHMIMGVHQAHVVAVATSNATNQQNLLPPPPPPVEALVFCETKINKSDDIEAIEQKSEEKILEDWYKSMAEEAASAAQKANATLNTKNNNDKKVL